MKEKNAVHSLKDFAEAVKEAACREFPEKKAIIDKVPKNNGLRLVSLCIYGEDWHVAPNIYLEPYYEEFTAGTGFEDVCREIFRKYRHYAVNPELESLTASLKDFEKNKNNICYRLINTEKNKELLDKIPCRPFLDLTVAYFIRLPIPEEMESSASILIHNSIMERWGVDESILYSLARENTPRIGRGEIMPLDYILNDDIGISQPEEGRILSFKDYDIKINLHMDPLLYVATNTLKCQGAAVILYEGLLRDFAEKTGCSFYILPSSIHELLFLPDTCSTDARDLSNMVKSVNTTNVRPEEFLSNSVYYYHAETGRLKITA